MRTTAIDTETFLFFAGYMAPELVCVSFADKRGDGVIAHSDPALESWLRERLEERTVWANAPYDLAVIAAKFPRLVPVIFRALDDGRIHDVQTREKLLDLARGTFRFEEDDETGEVRVKGYSLFEITLRRLGRRLEKDIWRLRYHELWGKPIETWPSGALDYATEDARATLDVFRSQRKLRAYLGNEAAQVRAHFALHLMTCHGFRTDPDAVEELQARVIEEIAEVKAELVKAGLVREDGSRDMKAAIRRMIKAQGSEVVLTKTGLELLADGVKLRRILRRAKREGKFVSVSHDAAIYSGDDTMIAFARYGQLRNLITGSIKDLRGGTILPIQSRFEVLMETGRTNSSSPNIQNLRRAPGVRECFVPRPGYVIVAADYSSAELHTLAQVCFELFGFSKLREALNTGLDVHLWLGAKLAQVSYEDAVLLIEAGDDHIKDMRQLAKAANFGFPGGCSARRFVAIAKAWGVDISLREAAKLKNLWLETWPELSLYFAYISKCEVGNGLYWVKQVRSERLRSNCTYTSACNSYFQGLCADGAKAALYAVTKAQFDPESPLFGTACLAFIHDEILIEVPEDRVHEAALELARIMETEFNRFTPDCPTRAEATAMRRWTKKAKPVYEEGRLVPWELAA